VYTFVDGFNNVITMPLDIDLSNIATLTASAATAPDPTNANQVTVTVSGNLQYQSTTGMQPLSNSNVFIYYDTNINYYNVIYNPATDPTDYFKYSLLCAFATGTSTCQLANPLSTVTQPGVSAFAACEAGCASSDDVTGCLEGCASVTGTSTLDSGPSESQTVDYSPDFNAIGQCEPPSTSLLAISACYMHEYDCECNIYGDFNLPSVQASSANPKVNQYCLPIYMNGNGLFTSQLGLVTVAQTDANGNFIAQFTACGSGTESITAEYYGSPPPEPIPVDQPTLESSANPAPYTYYNPEESAYTLDPTTSAVTNNNDYTYSPSVFSLTISIGGNPLSFGSISVAAMLLFSSALLVLFLRRSLSKGKE
jgi:hypothetical protein